MPDLLTHALVNVVLAGRRLGRDELAVFALASALPDLASRAPTILLARWVEPSLHGGATALDVLSLGVNVFHIPFGLGLLALVLAAAWPESALPTGRWRLAGLIALGGLTHLALDVLQAHLQPAYRMLWPLSLRTWEAGLLDPELSIVGWPILLPWAAWSLRRVPPRAP